MVLILKYVIAETASPEGGVEQEITLRGLWVGCWSYGGRGEITVM